MIQNANPIARKENAITDILRRQAFAGGVFLVFNHPRQANTKHGKGSRNPASQQIAFSPSNIPIPISLPILLHNRSCASE
jgi:hypothetical protein